MSVLVINAINKCIIILKSKKNLRTTVATWWTGTMQLKMEQIGRGGKRIEEVKHDRMVQRNMKSSHHLNFYFIWLMNVTIVKMQKFLTWNLLFCVVVCRYSCQIVPPHQRTETNVDQLRQQILPPGRQLAITRWGWAWYHELSMLRSELPAEAEGWGRQHRHKVWCIMILWENQNSVIVLLYIF